MRPIHDRAGRLVDVGAPAGPRELLDVAIGVVVDLADPLRLGRVRVEHLQDQGHGVRLPGIVAGCLPDGR